MRAVHIAAVLTALTLLLGGCAGTPEIPFDRAATSDVKTIGVITPKFPDDAKVILASSPAQSFGLVGALVGASLQANRESTFKGILDQQHFSARDQFLQNLTAGLQAQGYGVAMIPVTRDKAGFLEKYPTGDGNQVDAYLDLVTTGYSYIAAGISDNTPYRPFYAVGAKLVRARDASILMQDFVVYNPINPRSNVISIAPDPEYQFVDFDTLTSDPTKATTGLGVAVAKSAATVSNLLR